MSPVTILLGFRVTLGTKSSPTHDPVPCLAVVALHHVMPLSCDLMSTAVAPQWGWRIECLDRRQPFSSSCQPALAGVTVV